MWQKGHQIRWLYKWVTKKCDIALSQTIVTNMVTHKMCYQHCHQIDHKIRWITKLITKFVTKHPGAPIWNCFYNLTVVFLKVGFEAAYSVTVGDRAGTGSASMQFSITRVPLGPASGVVTGAPPDAGAAAVTPGSTWVFSNCRGRGSQSHLWRFWLDKLGER